MPVEKSLINFSVAIPIAANWLLWLYKIRSVRVVDKGVDLKIKKADSELILPVYHQQY